MMEIRKQFKEIAPYNRNETEKLQDDGEFDPRMIDQLASPAFVVKVLSENHYTLTYFNRELGIASGLIPEKTFDIPLEDAFHPELAAWFTKNYDDCTTTRQKMTYDEFINLPNGHTHWKTSLSPVFDRTGEITHIIGTTCHLSAEVGALQTEIENHSALISRYQEYRDNFNAAAHDLRSPICQLHTAIALIALRNKEHFKDNELDRLLKSSKQLVDTLLAHLDAVLSESQPHEAKDQNLHQFKLGVLFQEIHSVLDPMGKIAVKCPEANIVAEKILIQIVLRNLVDNAIKHNPDQQNLQVKLSLSTPQTGFIKFDIEDNGKGIENIPAALNAASESGENTPGRTEHGLPTIKRMIIARGGELHLTNKKTGLLVSFQLPGHYKMQD